MNEKTKYIELPESDSKHYVGDADCDACFESPKECKCGGLIHSTFGDENWDSYWLYYRCDLCGEDYETKEDAP